jgi:MFS family permease
LRDVRLLFATRIVRMFGYGFLAVVLVLYLAAIGLDGGRIGLLLALTLAGDTLISLFLTTRADRLGRRRVLIVGALLMIGGAVVFLATDLFPLLLLGATIGVISPSGNEVGPFLPVEQASLSQTVSDDRRTGLFAWYNLVGSVATAVGALTAGLVAQAIQSSGATVVDSYRAIVAVYAGLGLVMALLFSRLGATIEAPPSHATVGRLGLGKSRSAVLRLSALFSLDAFAGGLVPLSILAYWFHVRFTVEPALLGAIFFGANILAAVSALSAARLARRFGLINTMVFTHLPSNILLLLVPLMPTLELAVIVLLARFSISQMDVPTRQSYTMAVVEPDERSAAAGVTSIARTTGAAISPVIAGPLVANPALAPLTFVIAGGLKIVYDLLLWRSFRAHPAPGEGPPPPPAPSKPSTVGSPVTPG